MPPIDQSRPYQARLNDFGPELGRFLDRVWQGRRAINLNDFDAGVAGIYNLYAGGGSNLPYSRTNLETFVTKLKTAAAGNTIVAQSLPRSSLSARSLRVHGSQLWTDFFHVLSSDQPAKPIRSRVYVHAQNWQASIRLMEIIIGQFGKNQGLWAAKTAGPGEQRLDTIVCYLYDAAQADALVAVLTKESAGLVTDSLPPLVKRVAPGIGTADEPPAIEIYNEAGARHSFGSFFSTLCWIGLKGVKDINLPTADGRHLLDNVLHSLRLLRIEPSNPQRFPEAAALESWFEASLR